MTDTARPVDDATATLANGFREMQAIREQVHQGIETATDQVATLFGHPVNPDMLAGVLLLELGQIVVQWGAVGGARPEVMVEYFDSLLRRARRGFRVQLDQALNSKQSGQAPQNRIVTP